MNTPSPSAATLDPVRLLRTQPYLVAALLLFAYALWHPAYSMYTRWVGPDSYYSHGFLIPLISVWLVWRQRERLVTLPISCWWPGLFLAVLGVLSYLFGEYQGSAFPSYVAFLLLLTGGVGFLFGLAVLQATLFPILFLVFMLPLPGNTIAKLTYSLKYQATETAVWLIQAVGIVCRQSGSQILFVYHGEVVPLLVGDVCSGLRSLIALVAMGALFAYLSRHTPVGKTLLFLLSMPIAFATNVLRIIALCLVANATGAVPQMIHDVTGYLIYAVALALLFLVDWLIGVVVGTRPEAGKA